MKDLWFEDLSIGFGVRSEPILLTRDAIIRFAGEFDPQPFHLSEEGAANSFFATLVASGAHSYALTMRLGVNAGVFTGNAIAGLGVDEMRFLKPLLPESKLSATFTVKSLRESRSKPHLGIVHWLAETYDDNGVRVFSAIIKNLVLRDPQRQIVSE
ncbi:dehydratase [Rhizobium sp. NZLR1b]|uniref:MaoC/PaaZ C-terminal domain-containing protein n=1 Tax=unclassified Rhizobium TaxID=2613769 RepID=UPI001C839852|nr:MULTISPECIES: MaoC/PaaZ C-terminal domain-containing protein [unclassified Rhizobium]MBX5173339.1 dehydratase [Rhizobium sp. NZLR1b]MBX5192594.1 dehydratase [Rhizobium sp. NZLR3b]